MNIYKVEQDDVRGYDTFDSAVIIAENMQRAKEISIEELKAGECWTDDVEKITATHIGWSFKNTEDIVVASFNAG